MDPVGVISLVYDVSKDLYTYYQAVKDCDADIKGLRTQLLTLQHTSSSLCQTLKRNGLRTEVRSDVEDATAKCEEAATALKCALDKINLDGAHPQKALEKLKAVGRKAVYPFRKSTIIGLAEDVETCQDALHIAIDILQLNAGATTVEQLQSIDDRLVAGTATIETDLKKLEIVQDSAKDEIIQHLLHHRKLLENVSEEKRAKAIVDSLRYPEMSNRRFEIADAHDDCLRWLFTNETHEYPGITSLLNFLNEESGYFWIQGRPASGKSVFMKYLLDRSDGRDKLWEWAGARDVIFASHFCWISGTTMQKSKQGMLQSLLFQVLTSDLALVPIACPSHWTDGINDSSWYEKRLWDCLDAAITASDKRFCFFIDGLDEVQPEKDHFALAKALSGLSMHKNVKVVASSRPWPAFERALERVGKVLIMEDINGPSIINYVQTELEVNATDETFAHVDWACIRSNPWCPLLPEHEHDDAHHMIKTITERADGVFLWVKLVMEAVCRHLEMHCPVSVLRSYVDKFPDGLEEYFRTMIFKRLHRSLISETAMALKIASLGPSPMRFYALLCDYTDSGASRLTDPDFLSAVPLTTCTPEELTSKLSRTMNFLRGCCRDILDCKWDLQDLCYDGYHWKTVEFTHRTIADFIQTAEMRTLLERHIPKHFMSKTFLDELMVASLKLALPECNPSKFLRYCNNHSGGVFSILSNFISNRAECTYVELAAEKVAMHHFEYHAKCSTISSAIRHDVPFNLIMSLILQFATWGLFSFADSVVHDAPYFLATTFNMALALQRHGPFLGCGRKSFAVEITRKLLAAGIDINEDDLHKATWELRKWAIRGDLSGRTSIWRTFIAQMRPDADVAGESRAYGSESSTEASCDDPRQPDTNSTAENLYSDPCAQDMIKMFVEHGADLQPEDVDMLTSCLPSIDVCGFDWPGFLHTYSQPAKRMELDEARRRRIQQWPETWLSGRDKQLLGMQPDSVSGTESGVESPEAGPEDEPGVEASQAGSEGESVPLQASGDSVSEFVGAL